MGTERVDAEYIKRCYVCKKVIYGRLDHLLEPKQNPKVVWSVCEKHKGGRYSPDHPEWVKSYDENLVE